MRCGVSIALPALSAFAAHIQGMARHHAGRPCRLGPCPQAPQTRGKRPFARGVLRLPPPLLDLSQPVAQCCGGSLTDGEKRMEKTQDPRAGGAQGLPRAWRGLPALGLARLQRLSGLQGLRCAGNNARHFFQGSLGG